MSRWHLDLSILCGRPDFRRRGEARFRRQHFAGPIPGRGRGPREIERKPRAATRTRSATPGYNRDPCGGEDLPNPRRGPRLGAEPFMCSMPRAQFAGALRALQKSPRQSERLLTALPVRIKTARARRQAGEGRQARRQGHSQALRQGDMAFGSISRERTPDCERHEPDRRQSNTGRARRIDLKALPNGGPSMRSAIASLGGSGDEGISSTD